MNFQTITSSPIWRTRQNYLFHGEANDPTLYDFDSNGYVHPTPGRSVSEKEQSLIDKYNEDRAKLLQNQKRILDNFLRRLSPTIFDLVDEFQFDFYPDEILDQLKRKTQSASNIPSPIILDLDGTGINTVGLAAGVNFDHAADGFAERTGWAAAGDGLLVRDLDSNGSIDSGRELFGSETLLPNGSKAPNGFEALKALDTNADGVINTQDLSFAELRIWQDANSNGRTDAGELRALANSGVQSINVGYANSSHIDPQGNVHRQVGSYTTTDGQSRGATDVWVQTNATYSVPTDWVEVSEDIAVLPDAQGYGKVRDLHQAMAMDATGELKTLVTAFTQATTPEDRDALVTQVIYRWTGVQDVDPTSRAARMIYGNAIGDARKLEALEEFMGEEWVGVWCWGTRDPNPHGRAAPVLLAAWDELKALVYGQLIAQSQRKDLFQQISYRWDDEISGLVGDLSKVAASLAASINTDRDVGLEKLGDFLQSTKSIGLLNQFDVERFKADLSPLSAEVALTIDTGLTSGISANLPTQSNDVLRSNVGSFKVKIRRYRHCDIACANDEWKVSA
jgi:hypothetical protein